MTSTIFKPFIPYPINSPKISDQVSEHILHQNSHTRNEFDKLSSTQIPNELLSTTNNLTPKSGFSFFPSLQNPTSSFASVQLNGVANTASNFWQQHLANLPIGSNSAFTNPLLNINSHLNPFFAAAVLAAGQRLGNHNGNISANPAIFNSLTKDTTNFFSSAGNKFFLDLSTLGSQQNLNNSDLCRSRLSTLLMSGIENKTGNVFSNNALDETGSCGNGMLNSSTAATSDSGSSPPNS